MYMAIDQSCQVNHTNIEFNKHCENAMFAIIVLGMVGLLYIFNITFLDNGYKMVLKQVIYFLCASLLFCLISFLPSLFIRIFIHNLHIVFIVNILLFVFAYFTPLGAKINNAIRWIKVGPIYFQPSEFLKYTTILFIWWLYEFTSLKLVYKTLLSLGSIILSALLIGISPDIGTMAEVALLSLLLYFFFFPAKKNVVIPLAIVIAGGAFLLLSFKFSHIKKRLEGFKNPEVELQGKNYQAHQLKISVYASPFYGEGFGNSVQKLKYLPNAFNDFILGIIIEELGLMGLIGLLALYFYLFSNIIYCISLSSHKLVKILLVSFFLYNLFNLIINVLVSLGFFPIKGIALPFVSLGGSFIMANFIFFGFAIRLNELKNLPLIEEGGSLSVKEN